MSCLSLFRKRRPRRQSPGSLPAVVLCLDDEKKDVQEGLLCFAFIYFFRLKNESQEKKSKKIFMFLE